MPRLGFFWSITVLDIGLCTWIAQRHDLVLRLFLEARHGSGTWSPPWAARRWHYLFRTFTSALLWAAASPAAASPTISHYRRVRNPSPSTQLPHSVSLALPCRAVIWPLIFFASWVFFHEFSLTVFNSSLLLVLKWRMHTLLAILTLWVKVLTAYQYLLWIIAFGITSQNKHNNNNYYFSSRILKHICTAYLF